MGLNLDPLIRCLMLQWIETNKLQKVKRAIVGVGLLFAMAFFVLQIIEPAHAQQSVADPNSPLNVGLQTIEQPLGLPSTDIRLIIANIIRAALGLMGIVLVGLILYAGFIWMTSAGNEETIAKAKKIIVNAVIGLAIILSAYSIVLFVMKMLGVGDGVVSGPSITVPGTENFQGSGALGKIIKDHYPVRNQIDVARNSKILITFRQPIRPNEFITDTNNDGIFGNCKSDMADWINDCDRVKLESQYITIVRTDTGTPIVAAAIMATTSTLNNTTGVYTIVIKPITDLNDHPSGGYLGASNEKISYTVRLGSGIKLDDPINNNPSALTPSTIGNNYYDWQFTCSTELDVAPPKVMNVFPEAGAKEASNSVIQVDFSEPIDPTGIQGRFADAGGYFKLAGDNVFLQTGQSSVPVGVFVLTNGYRTLEFTPETVCGENACGGKIFCLPVCDVEKATCNADTYKILLKAAQTFNANSFEARPFTGIMDLAGNALDSDPFGKVNSAPTDLPVFSNWEKPDNYVWRFQLTKDIDKTAPYLMRIMPGVEAENIPKDYPWLMVFSKRMRVDPMYGITVVENPPPSNNIPLWIQPRISFGNILTTTTMYHGPFLDGMREDYMPILTSAIEDVHFNCFYPGLGPGGTAEKNENLWVSNTCDANGDRSRCCLVDSAVGSDFCCNGEVSNTKSSTTTCINSLK